MSKENKNQAWQEVPEELSTCPKCGSKFHCSTSGKCWCVELYVPPEKMEQIRREFDSCLCPNCLKEYSE